MVFIDETQAGTSIALLLWNEKGYVESTMEMSEAPGLSSYWLLVSVLASSAEDRGFEPRSGQTKDYIGMCCFPVKNGALRCKN